MYKARKIVSKVSQILTGVAILVIALTAGLTPLPVAQAANPPVYENHTESWSSLWRSDALFPHTVFSGSYRLLAVAVMIRADESVSSVTYADQALALAKVQDDGGSDDQKVELWYLVNPPVVTAKNVIVHFASSVNPSGIAAVNFTGVDQTDPIGRTAGASSPPVPNDDATTDIITENADSLIFGAVSARGGDITFSPGTDITEIWDSDTGSDDPDDDDGLWGGYRVAHTAGGGGYQFQARLNSADNWAIACLELNAAPAPTFSGIIPDKSAYKDGDTISLRVTLEDNNTACTLTADFSNIDDQYVTGAEDFDNWGTDTEDNNGDGHINEPAEQGIYVIRYTISTVNSIGDGSYSVPVTATDGVGNSTPDSTSLNLDNTAPPSPTNLTATALAGGGIKLTWTASSPETDVANYNIYRATSSGGQNYTSFTYQVASGTTTYTDSATTSGTTYYYVVRAQDVAGNTDTNTEEASATAGITAGPSFSSITSDKSVYKNGDTVTLTVTLANHNTGCTLTADFSNIDSQYVTGGESVVNWGTDGVDNNGDGKTDEPAEQGIYVISYLISLVNTKADGSHSVPVTATDAASNTATSSISLTLDNTAPPAPTSLSATAIAGGSIKLTWTASSPETDVSQYNIYRATTSAGQDYSSTTYTVSAGITTYTDTSTTDGQTYYYVVRAQDAAGNIETNTNEVSATASGTGSPAPTNLSAAAIAGGSIKLTWTASSPETNVAQYNVYRATTSGGQDYNSSLASVSAGTTTYTDTTTTDGVTYYYVVRAQDNIGNIETNTNEASATADATPPPAPTDLVATGITDDGIQLTWTASSPETDVAQYNIYRATTSGGQSYTSPTYTVSSGTTTYTDTSTTDGVTYYYVVRAQDAAGNIETNTNEVSAVAGYTSTVSQIYIKYQGALLYNLASSTDRNNPAVFTSGSIDEIYLKVNLLAGSPLNESASSIGLYKLVDSEAEEVSGTQEINQNASSGELIFHISPVFDPGTDDHSRDGLYWVDASAVDTAGNTNNFDFYFVYDTTPPEVPSFQTSSFDSATGSITVSGSTVPDELSDPQEVEIFINDSSKGTATAGANYEFSKSGIGLVRGINYIAAQSADKAGNKSRLSKSLKLSYNPESLLSIVIRSPHVVRSGSSTEPVKIIYSVTQPAEITIRIFNLKGLIVKEWSGSASPGEETEWDWYGKNMYEEEVNNGVYIFRIKAKAGSGENDSSTKLVGVLR